MQKDCMQYYEQAIGAQNKDDTIEQCKQLNKILCSLKFHEVHSLAILVNLDTKQLKKVIEIFYEYINNLLQKVIQCLKLNQLKDLNQEIKKLYIFEEQFKSLWKLNCTSRINETLDDFLEERKPIIDDDTLVHKFASKLIDMYKITEYIPSFQSKVEEKVKGSVSQYIKEKGPDEIFHLAIELQKKHGVLGTQIVERISEFIIYKIYKFNKKTHQHDKEYVLNNFQYSENIKSMNSLLLDQQKKNLDFFYSMYESKYKELVDKYITRLNFIQNIPKNAIALLTGKKLNLKDWNNESKELSSIIIAHIFAYWTLICYKDMNYKKSDKFYLKTPHHSQIFTILILLGCDSHKEEIINMQNQYNHEELSNHFVQILTGEGKSLTLGAISTLIAMAGYNVDVACYSNYLSERDKNSFQFIFKAFQVESRIMYGTFSDLSNRLLNINGDIRQMSLNLIQGGLNQITNNEELNTILLIDEVDVFFSQNYYGQSFQPIILLQSKDISELMEKIWQMRKKSYQQIIEEVKQSQQYTNIQQQYQQWQEMIETNIRCMAKDVLKLDTHNYECRDGKIGYKESDATINFKKYIGYQTIFAYFKERDEKRNSEITQQILNEKIGIKLKAGYFSYAEALSNYQTIFGVTGTLENINLEMKIIINSYINKFSLAPSLFGIQKREWFSSDDTNVQKDLEDQWLTIKEITNSHLKKGQAILIFFRNKIECENYKKSNYRPNKQEDEIIILSEQTEDKEHHITRSTYSKSVTLIVKDFGRGSDFICNDPITNDNGGVVVIQSFLSEDETEEAQIRGRTGRAGENGKCYIVLNKLDIMKDFDVDEHTMNQYMQSKKDIYKSLNDLRNRKWGDSLKNLTTDKNNIKKEHVNTMKYKQELQTANKQQQCIEMLKQINLPKAGSGKNQGEQTHFIFAMDDSGSMSAKDDGKLSRWDYLIESFEGFVKQRKQIISEDLISVIYQSSDSIIVSQFEKKEKVIDIVKRKPPRFGGTIFYKAVDLVYQLIAQRNTMNTMVLFLSDGGDCEGNAQLLPNSLNKLKTAYKHIIQTWWNVGFGRSAGSAGSYLRQMTDIMKDCGGEYKEAITAAELAEELEEFAQAEEV